MAQNHYVTKRKRRPKNKNRKDWTRETMLSLRSPEAKQAAFTRAMQIADAEMEQAYEKRAKLAQKTARWQ